MADATNIHTRMVERIDEALPRVSDDEDTRKLRYIRSQLTASGLEKRDEWSGDVSHLHDVARTIIRRFTPKQEASTDD